MIARAVRVAWLVGIWLALWSDVSIANILSGVVVASVVVVVFDTRAGATRIRPLHAIRFLLYFLARLVVSTAVVAMAVIAPANRVCTGIVSIRLRFASDALATLIADAISLTPGTLTLEIQTNPTRLYVHVLDVRDIEQVRRDVRKLELLAVRAFGEPAAVADAAIDDVSARRSP